jgi:M6 family metalloprotease-like protein
VTLVWADAPGAAGAARSQVNDLDLTVTSPDGTQTFLGNSFVGGVSVTGGAADADNNVEMVLVNAPAPGVWTITVTPTNVTVGNPAQGYALVATADMPESPAPTGNQNTLVVPVRFNDIPTGPSMANINTRVLNAVDYFDTVSYGETTILPETTALVNLDNATTFYYDPSRSLLVELVQEVVTKLGAAAFTRGTADPADDIARMVIVTNDASFTGDWATTGAWPYDIPGGATRPISVSIQSDANDDARFSHGLSHQFGLVDLYAHPGVTFARPQYADHWDNMATPFENEHPLAWSKQRAEWLTAHGATITFIPRPAAGLTTTSAALQLFPQDLPGANRKAIAIGLTPGSTLATENVFYFVEARDTSAPYDTNLPAEGVLVYLVNETIPQGQGPVILRDPNAGTDALEAFAVPSTPHTIPGTGITIEVLAPTGGALANIRVTYAAPATDFNLRITRGDTRNGVFRAWYSPDIWLDSPANGENFATSPPPEDQIERPIPGEPNRIRVRIFNDGPAIAENFDVRVRISEPYHTIGDQADFDTIVGLIHVDGLVPTGQAVPPGMLASGSVLTFVWTPADTGNAHSCVWVEFLNVSGTDVNANDNAAQENLERITSETGSPYHPTEFHFQMENPYAEAALFYFRVDGAPDDWTIVLDPKKVRLLPGQQIEGKLTVTPPENEKLCSSRVLEVTSWTPRGDTLIPVGGSVVQVDMRRPTVLTLDVGEDKCRGDDFEQVLGGQRHCRRVTASGCTNPPQPNTRIWLRYKAPDGTSIWHEVMTDANGCYEDFLVTSEGTEWSVTAGFEGNDCQGPTRTGPKGEGGGRPAFGDLGDDWWYSLHLGHNFPLGDLRKSFASGPSITIDLEREWRDRWSIYAVLGYHYFDAKFPGGDETYFTNLSLSLRAYAAAGPWRRFIGFGPGLYRQEGGSTEGGLNVSAGLEFPIVTSLRLETGADLHLVDPTGDRRMFIDVKLGVKWRF